MKNLIKISLAFFFITILNSCKDEENQNDSGYNCKDGNCIATYENPQYLTLKDCQSACAHSTAGYNCISGTCVAVSNNAQYPTLAACQTSCANSTFGSLEVNVNGGCGCMFLGAFVALSVADLDAKAYITSFIVMSCGSGGSSDFKFAPGAYYLRVGRANVSNPGCIATTVTKSFIITAGKRTSVNVNVN
ncbi:MAG: hypothetical protein LBG17_07380 [Bacteroidales bacterium]|jgi:hypothetical protein|nr:hypothetical protein [Bacteroidales bacterium]